MNGYEDNLKENAMKIFLTGGAGYIGSMAVRALLEAGHQVTVYDSLVTGYRAAVPRTRPSSRGTWPTRGPGSCPGNGYLRGGDAFRGFHRGRGIHEKSPQVLPQQPDELGQPDRRRHQGRGETFCALLHRGGLPVQRPAPQRGIPPGAGQRLRPYQADDRGSAGILPRDLRAALRRPALFQRRRRSAEQGEAHQPESHLIPLVLQVPLGQRQDIKIYGTDYPTPDGTCIRDYIHIADLVSAHLLALDALEKEEKLVYNLGNGKGYSVREVIETAREVTGHPIPAEETPRRPGDSPRLVASSGEDQKGIGLGAGDAGFGGYYRQRLGVASGTSKWI